MPDPLYLDYAATTPVIASAREAMADGLARWANPSSPHGPGRAARAALEEARGRIAAALGWDGEVILTGGASESIAIALGRTKAARRIVSTVEHDAVLRIAGKDAAALPVERSGLADLGVLERLLGEGDGPALVAVQQVNNETGVIQDWAAISALCARHGAIRFADCAQGAGKLDLAEADLIAVSAHKLGGPPGIGALLVRDLAHLEPSGGQEKGYRAGTENLPAALGFAAALEAPRDWLGRAETLRQRLDAAIADAGGAVIAAAGPRIATIGSYRMPGLSARAQLIRFDLAGIAVSAGSACSSGTLKASHVLTAMGHDDIAAGEVVRVSFGPETGEADIDRFLAAWRTIHDRAKAA